MVEYKARWSEAQTELQQQLKAAKKVRQLATLTCHSPLLPPSFPPPSLPPSLPQEAREALLRQEKAEEERGELSDTVEMATLDKEMAGRKGMTLIM